MPRKVFDCRELPGDCTLAISGEEAEVLDAQAQHAVSAHGQQDGPELRAFVRSYLKDETASPA